MASCVDNIAGNIGLNCENPIAGGYTGRGVYIPVEMDPILTRATANPRQVIDITFGVVNPKVVRIDNQGATPFTGSQTVGTNENGRPQFIKTVQIMMPERGADFAKNVAEPLVKGGRGGIIILEKVDRVGDGSYEIIGTQQPAKVIDPSTVTRNEYENGGAWTAVLQSTEDYMEVVFLDHNYDATLQAFELFWEMGF